MEHNILIVDDEKDICRSLAEVLKRDNHRLTITTSPLDALELMSKRRFSLVISDQRMPKMCGTEFLTEVKKNHPYTLRILLSAYSDYDALLDSINEAGVYKFLSKPWNNNLIRKEVRTMLAHVESINQERLLTALYKNSIEAMLVLDQDQHIVMANPAFCCLTQRDENQLVGNSINNLILTEEEKEIQIESMLDQNNDWRGELKCQTGDKQNYIPIWSVITRLPDHVAEDRCQYTFLFVDITEIKQKEQKIIHLAYHDFLTDLPNRRALLSYLDQRLLESKRSKSALCILFVGLDNFKWINNTLGHDCGDKVIRIAATRIKAELRSSDMLGRIGGDEFVVILPDCMGAFSASDIAIKLNNAISLPMNIGGQRHCLSTSIGISELIHGSETSEELLTQADKAMYQAKNNGKNTYVISESGSECCQQPNVISSQEIIQAISRDQFVMHYQPVINANSYKVVGYEALVRWQHPTQGLLYPNEFIGQAEESGIIDRLDAYIIEKTVRQSRLFQSMEKSETKAYLSINVSAPHLEQAFFLEKLKSCLAYMRFSDMQLQIEITETNLLKNIDDCAETLRGLRSMGVKIAVDDFGTGYSSLAYINKLPIDTIKIDQSFISEIENSDRARKIISSIIDLSRSLEIVTIAEGVETQAQLDYLLKIGCFNIQGYYYSKPMPLDEVLGPIAYKTKLHLT